MGAEPARCVAEADLPLALDGVARRFARRWVLRGIRLSVEPGEAVALMGRNGSGKTTLLRIVSTALSPTRGGGRIFGRDLLSEGDRIREVVGVLAHSAGLYEDLSAAENLRFALRMNGLAADRQTILRVLSEVGLAGEVDERVRGFSSGMRRRLSLARVLLRPPRLLLLDEPYASFDVDGIDLVNAFVRRVVDGGGAALVATHDLRRALSVVDRVVRIEDGLLVEGAADTAEDDASPAADPFLLQSEGV